jgi:hypothetical protein
LLFARAKNISNCKNKIKLIIVSGGTEVFGALSNDPLLSLLRSFGYNVVRLPRSSITPLQLFTRKDTQLYPIGPLQEVFVSRGNVSLPAIQENQPLATFSGKKSGELSTGLGLSVLGGIISAFGGSIAGIAAKYKQAKSVSFQYEDVLEDSVMFAQLDRFLADADIDPLSKCVGDLLESDQVYVTTSTLKSKKFTVIPQASKGGNLDIKAPEIQNLVGANVTITSDEESSSTITFEGKTPLVFGFQVWQLFYQKGKYGRAEPPKKELTLGPSKKSGAKLLTQGPFASLRDS